MLSVDRRKGVRELGGCAFLLMYENEAPQNPTLCSHVPAQDKGGGGRKYKSPWVTSRRFARLEICLGFRVCQSHATQGRVWICFRVEPETPHPPEN